MMLLLLVLQVCRFDHITNGCTAALEYKLIILVVVRWTALCRRIKGLSEDIHNLLSIFRQLMLYTVEKVNFILVRLLLCQKLVMVLGN